MDKLATSLDGQAITYDAWGVPTIFSDTSDCGIASINPFRYRGYFYDNEIGLYYLQSRYYNPITGTASWVIDVLAACGFISVAPPLAVALLIFGGICLVWDVLRYFGVI